MDTKKSEVKVNAKSIDLALVKASGILQLPQNEITYKVLSQSQPKGLFSFLKSAQIEILAWPKSKRDSNFNSRRPARNSHPAETRRKAAENLEPAKELDPVVLAELKEELKVFCQTICQGIVGAPLEIEAFVEGDRLVLNIKDKEFIELFNKNVKLAEALEHLLRKKPRHLKQELPFRIFVDVEGTRKAREQELTQMASEMSEKVFSKKRPIVLNYRSAYDRKIIHMALDQDDRVYTKSIGSGQNRKLMILPFNKGQEETASYS